MLYKPTWLPMLPKSSTAQQNLNFPCGQKGHDRQNTPSHTPYRGLVCILAFTVQPCTQNPLFSRNYPAEAGQLTCMHKGCVSMTQNNSQSHLALSRAAAVPRMGARHKRHARCIACLNSFCTTTQNAHASTTVIIYDTRGFWGCCWRRCCCCLLLCCLSAANSWVALASASESWLALRLCKPMADQ